MQTNTKDSSTTPSTVEGVNNPNPKTRNTSKGKSKPAKKQVKAKPTEKKTQPELPKVTPAIKFQVHPNDSGSTLTIQRGSRFTSVSGKRQIQWDEEEIIRISNVQTLFDRNFYHKIVILVDKNKSRQSFVSTTNGVDSHSVESLIYKMIVDGIDALPIKEDKVESHFGIKPSIINPRPTK